MKNGSAPQFSLHPVPPAGPVLRPSVSAAIRARLDAAGVSYLANDCIADHISAEERVEIEREVEDIIGDLLGALVIDVERDHNSRDTARRVAKMYCREVFGGRFDPRPAITDFPNAKGLDEVYTVGPITVRSACAHHLCPILGRAWCGIIPGERVIGLSKFNRLADWVLARPQIQEEAVVMLADEIEALTKPRGLAVVIKATHACMTWRGVRETPSTVMTTSVMRGLFKTLPEARAEFLTLAECR